MTAFAAASSSLRTLAGSSQDDASAVAEPEEPAFTDEEALHFAMERLYRDGLRQPPFKVCLVLLDLVFKKTVIPENINPNPIIGTEARTNNGQGR
jgi:hypothetical protein